MRISRRAFRRTPFAIFSGLVTFATAIVLARPAAVPADIPQRLTDAEFWRLSELASEPNGDFQSDNFLSNERGYQIIIPDLLRTAKPGRIYLGVGPEQNFPYIIALKPALAIIFDVRRGNLHEHLLYKALFELSADRADFLSRLFSRKRPDGLTKASSVNDLMTAYANVAPSTELYQANLKDVTDLLTKKHGFALHDDDIPGIDYVYKTAFFAGGPNLTYSMAGRGARGGGFGGGPGNGGTYWEIQALDDGAGVNRGFLGSEENWAAMKEFETRNLLVPVVGDFGGPKAIRAVGQYLKEHDVVVSAFYLSNVEQYLNRAGTEQAFLCSVSALPLDASSTFVFTGAGRNGGGFGGGGGGGRGGGGGGRGGLNTTFLRPMLPDTQGCGPRN
jgi:hypothetical protein